MKGIRPFSGPMKDWPRWPVLVMVGVFFVGYLGVISKDFLLYWAAGVLFWDGRNPYDAGAVFEITRAVLDLEYPYVNWNPPWTLVLTGPFALLPFSVARPVWYVVRVVGLVWLSDRFWHSRTGTTRRRELAWMTPVLYIPVLHSLSLGQINLLVPIGLMLFLLTVEARRDFIAGASVLLIAAKPHLVYLFFVFLLLWCLRERRWAILGSSALALCVPVLAATIYSPRIMSDYIDAIRANGGPLEWATPTAGTVLRLAAGTNSPWLQFAPTIAGFIVAIVIWHSGLKTKFSWDRHLIPVVFLSVCTAPYAWSHDTVVLLPGILAIVMTWAADPSRRWWMPLGILVPELLAYGFVTGEFYAFWFPWVLAVVYALSLLFSPDLQRPRDRALSQGM